MAGLRSLPCCIPGSVKPSEQVHKEDRLAKKVGQQNGQPNLCMVFQPVENGCGRQEEAPKHLAQHLHKAYFCSAGPGTYNTLIFMGLRMSH